MRGLESVKLRPSELEEKAKILMVDDQPKNLRALEEMLADIGQDLHRARSGEEALKAVLGHEFAVILMDVQMPDMDGFETAALIRERENSRRTPIIFVTAIDKTEKNIFKGYSMGAVDYLFKPVAPEILRAKLAVFVDLYKKAEQIRQQEKLLRQVDKKDHERQLADARQRWENERLREEMEKERKIAQAMAHKADELARIISEREIALEARSRLATILEATSDLVATVSSDSQFLYLNRAGRKMLGISEDDDITRLRLLDYRSPATRDFMTKEAFPIAMSQGLWSGESAVVTSDGREIPVSQVVIAHKNAAGKLEFLSTIARDMTEHKKLEDQLRQSQKLEGIGQLAGGIAHDFNNLLTVILGRSELLMSRVDVTARRDVELIHKTGHRAAALTRQLLAFGRKQILQPRVIDLNAIVADLEKMLRRLIGEDIEIKTALKTDLGSVRADPGQIEQVIVNLVVNARDAMPEGGKLTIETANIRLDNAYALRHPGVLPGPYVMLAVSDNGCGMDAETRNRIFEPFFTTKTQGKGTGLGLSTVHGIVNQSGGHLWVYSEVGRGTTFKVYLPYVQAQADIIPSGDKKPAKRMVTETILLVEDEAEVRELAEEILLSAGYTVLKAATPQEALNLSKFHEGCIQLMVTDVIMPQMKGSDLAEALNSTRTDMKVLFMSGYTDTAISHHGVLEPGTHFLEKPFTAESLEQKVHEVLDN